MPTFFAPADLEHWLHARTVVRADRGRPASVLIPLLFQPDDISILFMKRPDDASLHGGQVSFPGGKREATDLSAIDTALREANEELGLRRAEVQILGELDALYTVTNFNITPVVGALREMPTITPSATEVADWFWVSLSALLDDNQWRNEQLPWRGQLHDTWFFDGGKHIIWGATAHMLRDLLSVIRQR